MTAVILFSENLKGECNLSHCPMSVTLFKNMSKAKEFANQQPKWTQPHCLVVNQDEI